MVREFDNISSDLGSIHWEAAPDILKTGDYVERWRIALWEKAFIPFFKGGTSFTKKSQLEDMPTGIQAIKRVLFRYSLTSLNYKSCFYQTTIIFFLIFLCIMF